MKIVKLTAENVKRIKAVEIAPNGDGLVIVTGRNGQGKSSVLDSIWYALGGKDAQPPRPIRDGEDHAQVTLDLGDLIVTRKWTANDKSYLTVCNAEGAKYPSPQAMLDNLVGRLSFDPLEFSRMKGAEQRSVMLSLGKVDLDLAKNARDRADAEASRRDIARDLKALEARFAAAPDAPEGTPDAEVSAAAAADALQEQINIEQAGIRHGEAVKAAMRATDVAVATRDRIKAQLDEATAEMNRRLSALESLEAVIVQAHDVPAAKAALAAVETTNNAVRFCRAKADLAAQCLAKRVEWQAAQGEIDALDNAKSAALAAAEFPVAGLGIDDDGITVGGIPFSQLADSFKLRVSMAMAMALNPKLRVIRVTDGSLLDGDSLKAVQDMAAQADYQIWIERVDETGKVGIVIEDGEVAATDKQQSPRRGGVNSITG